MLRPLKFTVPVDDGVHSIKLPKDAVVHGVMCQLGPDSVQFWAIVDSEKKPEHRAFAVIGTGHSVPEGFTVKNAFVAPGGLGLIWHLLELEAIVCA